MLGLLFKSYFIYFKSNSSACQNKKSKQNKNPIIFQVIILLAPNTILGSWKDSQGRPPVQGGQI